MERKTIVVVGASGAIGSQICKALDDKDFNLVLVGRTASKLKHLEEGLSPGRHRLEVLDLTKNIDEVASRVSTIVGGSLNVTSLVYAAGSIQISPFMQTSSKVWLESMETNLFGAVECIKGFLQGCSAEVSNKSIVLISSVASQSGQLGLGAYASSKAALESMAKSAARELARKEIRINTVQFGLIENGLGLKIQSRIGTKGFSELMSEYPLGQAESSDAANAAIFLMSEKARWITGASLAVDGGFLTR